MFQIGEIVKPSGLGRTGSWGDMFGIVTEVTVDLVYVAWHGLEFEDEMCHFELVSTRQFADYFELREPYSTPVFNTVSLLIQ